MASEIAYLPISGHIRVVRDFIEKERKNRNVSGRSSDRFAAVEEANRALDSLKAIEETTRKPNQ